MQAHRPHCVRSMRLEYQNKYFLVWASSSVNKSILLTSLTVAMRQNTSISGILYADATVSQLLQPLKISTLEENELTINLVIK